MKQLTVEFSSRLPRYSSVAVANTLLEVNASQGARAPTADQLQDWVYLAHGWHLGVTGRPLLQDQLMACSEGVFAVDLRETGCRGSHRIEEPISLIATDERRGMMVEQTPSTPEQAPIRAVLKRVHKLWGQQSAYELRQVVREVGGPWDLIWNDEERPGDEPQLLPTGTIQLWFADYAEAEQRRAALQATQKLLARPDPQRLRVV